MRGDDDCHTVRLDLELLDRRCWTRSKVDTWVEQVRHICRWVEGFASVSDVVHVQVARSRYTRQHAVFSRHLDDGRIEADAEQASWSDLATAL